MTHPLQRLLDLDAGRLPALRVRLDGREHALTPPDALPLAGAFRLGDLLRTIADPATPADAVDAAITEAIPLFAPELPAAALGPGHQRRLLAFYAGHLRALHSAGAESASQEGDGDAVPFSIAGAPPSPAPASPPSSASASAANSASPSPSGAST